LIGGIGLINIFRQSASKFSRLIESGKPNQINEGVITERIDPSVARLNESRELRSRLAKNIDQANTADQGILSETDAKSISYESERKSNVLNSIGLTPERWKFLAGIKD
jgi:hypothetical protein